MIVALLVPKSLADVEKVENNRCKMNIEGSWSEHARNEFFEPTIAEIPTLNTMFGPAVVYLI